MKAWQSQVLQTKKRGAMNLLKGLAGIGVVVLGVYLGWRGWGQ